MGSVRAQAGSTLGEYVLERKLGAGGMAEVYLARRTGARGFQKRVAIKRILPELSEDSQLIRMFCEEARVAASLTHPNIVQILEFAEQEGELYIVMEFVDGVSCGTMLRTVSQKSEAIPVGPSLYVAREVLLALSAVHEAEDETGRKLHLVHRDVSPSNILVSRIGNVKLIDFGIMRTVRGERRTFPGEVKGKLRYMSPEQILGNDVDSRSDIFAVGVVLAEMLTGRALFSGKNDFEILSRISRGEKGLLHDGRIPEDIAQVIDRALSHDPEDRFATAREFARALEATAAVRELRLDDTVIVPYLHAIGVLPSTSGTRPSAKGAPSVPGVPSKATPPPLPGSPSRVGSHASLQASSHASLPHPRASFPTHADRAPSSPGAPADEPDRAARAARARRSGTYRVKTKSGQTIGPLNRSDMLALLATGRLSARSHVSLRTDGFVTAGSLPALSALASHPAYRFRDDDATSPEWLCRIEAARVPSALYSIALGSQTGLLTAIEGKRRKRIFFEAGVPVFVASTNRDELLGRRLVTSGVVSEQAVELALGRQPPLRIGEALVSFGALTGEALEREVGKQLEERITELGQWRGGELRFFAGVTLEPGLHQKLPEPTLRLLGRLVREEFPPGDIATILRPFTKEPLTFVNGKEALTELLGLSKGEASAVTEVAAGAPCLRDVVTRATQRGASMAEALVGVFVGLCAGALRAPGWGESRAPSQPG